MNATSPLLHLFRRLRTNKKATENLNLMLTAKSFTECRQSALDARRQGRTNDARFWAQQARAEWRQLAPKLGLKSPPNRDAVPL